MSRHPCGWPICPVPIGHVKMAQCKLAVGMNHTQDFVHATSVWLHTLEEVEFAENGNYELSPTALIFLVTTPHSLCLGFIAALLIVTKLWLTLVLPIVQPHVACCCTQSYGEYTTDSRSRPLFSIATSCGVAPHGQLRIGTGKRDKAKWWRVSQIDRVVTAILTLVTTSW